MTQALIVFALAAGAYLLRRAMRHPAHRSIDVGPVSRDWITEHHKDKSQ
jgi:hypothetical protein